MADMIIQDGTLHAIADAIRAKNGSSATYTPDAMPGAIQAIETGESASSPAIGFVPSAWDDNGYITGGTWYGTTIPDNMFRCASAGIPWALFNIGLPSGLTSIGNYGFQGCKNLALKSLPNGLATLANYVFYGCTSLAISTLPSALKTINNQAFAGCTGLVSITFQNKPSLINASAFAGCTNLTTINVPWSDGEVANAPWGATNATINYNYTGG